MSGSTPELALKTAVDADDTADYLTLSLASSLTTIDALFNNTSGHSHSGAHQGGPITVSESNIADGSITSAKLQPPIDIGGYFRSTAFSAPTTGAGVELFYSSGTGTLQAYDRAGGVGRPLALGGTNISINGATAINGALTVNSNTSMAGALTVAGAIASSAGLSGTSLSLVRGNHINWTDGNSSFWVNTDNNTYLDIYSAAFSVRNSAAGFGNVFSVNGVGQVMLGGANLNFSNNSGVGIAWNGAQFTTTHAIMSGGFVAATGQVTAYGAYNGTNSNCFLAPNNAGQGTALAFAWNTWSSIAHAVEYNLPYGPVPDPLALVRPITGYKYEHTQFAAESGEPQQTEGGTVESVTTYGFAASEVSQYIPELATEESVDTSRMLAILWEAVKACDARITTLEAA